ncbi:MAG: non-canonical purine NTP pyrophosphatase, partial [Actinomycetota bacterium]
MRLVLATANPDKVKEIEALLPNITLLPRPPDVAEVVEDGATLEENARLKALALVQATGDAAVADDTGLFVDPLDGAPGVSTARFAGDGATYADNVAKMLAELSGVPAEARTARFVTVALARWPDGRE